MSIKDLTNRKNINPIVNETIFQFPSIQFNSNLEKRCQEVGINLTELSELTGIRYATINELKNNKKPTLNLQHVLAIMVALRLKSLDDLFHISFDDVEDQERYEIESEYYSSKGLPDSVHQKIIDNKERLNR